MATMATRCQRPLPEQEVQEEEEVVVVVKSVPGPEEALALEAAER